VRVGYPNTVGGLSEIVKNPMYATAVGLLLYGRNNVSDSNYKNGDKNIVTKVAKGMKNWFTEAF
jgi:cell division protein FtsA